MKKFLVIAAVLLSLTAYTPAPLAPCATEDSSNCYWNAATRGNGQGASFIAPNN